MTETSQSTGSTGKVVHAGNDEALRQAAGAVLLQASIAHQDVPAIASAPPPPPSLPPPVFAAPTSQPQVLPPPPPPSRASESQLPTSRLPSLPAVFSPELERALAAESSPPSTLPAPPVAQDTKADAKTIVLTKSRTAAMRASWRSIVSSVMHVAVKVPGRVSAVSAASRAVWTQKRVGVACGVLGLAMIVGPLLFGVFGLSAAHLDKTEPASIVAAVVLARAAIAVASMGIGYALLRVAERLAFPAAGLRLAPVPTVRPRV